MKVLVAGGSGRLGSLVACDLAQRGAEVRVLTREPRRAAHLDDVAELASGDVRDPRSLTAAVDGVDVVVSAVHGFAGAGRVTPQSVDRDGNRNLVDAAAAAGAHVVMVSVCGASADSPMELFRCKWAAEEHLRASGTGWTIVRATAFLEMWADLLSKHIVFGRGDNPINFVSVCDVASAVATAVVDPATRGRVIEVAGPEDLTFNELAALVQEARGDHAPIRHIPRAALRVLAKVHRQPAAALVMDTTDMTAVAHPLPNGAPPTSARSAIARLISSERAAPVTPAT